jgi:hypothetical protein
MVTKVTGLFKNYPEKSSNFLKIVHQSYLTFQKVSGKVIGFLKIVPQSCRTFKK